VAGQPPWMRAPPAGSLWSLAPREPPAGPLLHPAPQKPPAAPLPQSIASPRHSKPQQRPHVGVGRPMCPAKKNNDKIYRMKK
jgi:hypothetical protein